VWQVAQVAAAAMEASQQAQAAARAGQMGQMEWGPACHATLLLHSWPEAQREQLHAPAGSLIRLVPVTAGAKSELGQIIIGAALIYFAPVFGTTALIGNLTGAAIVTSLGFAMVLGGVSQLLAGNPASDAPSERPENLPSYAFNGAVNTTAQGNPVPVLYGRLRVGSQVISTGLSTAALAIE
jgi:predicted phage tail protein